MISLLTKWHRPKNDPVAATKVRLRELKLNDAEEFLSLMRASASFHNPWVQPPRSKAEFRLYLEYFKQNNHANFAVCEKGSDNLVGVINLNNIIRGCVMQASLGYYAVVHYAGQGYLREGMKLVIDESFQVMKLHRLEAHIQPDNLASIGLVKRLGFQYEGLMPQFMYINDAWRDHERWVLTDNRETIFRQE